MSTARTSATDSIGRPPRRRLRRLLAPLGAALALLGALLGVMLLRMGAVPADLDLAATRRTDQGLYQVSYAPSAGPIALNTLHSWTIRITTPDGAPVTDAQLSVDGDMPQHGHGLPTRPQATGHLGDGRYLIEGLKFQMGGWWVVDLTIDAAGKRDSVRFNLILS